MRGYRREAAELATDGVAREMEGRLHAMNAQGGLLPSTKTLPLVVIVAGEGAFQAWPTVLFVDAARLSFPSSGATSQPAFDLILLVPKDDTTSLLPCFGSQGCRPEGVDATASGLRVVRGAAVKPHEDLLAAEAIGLFDPSQHSALVIVSASAIPSTNGLFRMFEALEKVVEHDQSCCVTYYCSILRHLRARPS